ncbi:MAG: hypothetical protein NTV78_03575 [Caldiserica bacterium]|nr:hypothetical protein [Caldisericota bacterium]
MNKSPFQISTKTVMAAFAKNIASALLLASLKNTHFAVIPPLINFISFFPKGIALRTFFYQSSLVLDMLSIIDINAI